MSKLIVRKQWDALNVGGVWNLTWIYCDILHSKLCFRCAGAFVIAVVRRGHSSQFVLMLNYSNVCRIMVEAAEWVLEQHLAVD